MSRAVFDTNAQLDAVSSSEEVEAIVEATHHRAELQTQLLASGALTYITLARGLPMPLWAVHQWVHQARDRHELFTVEHQGEVFVPAFLLDEDLSPRREFQPIIKLLVEAGEDGWGLWAWLVFPSPWFDGAEFPNGKLPLNGVNGWSVVNHGYFVLYPPTLDDLKELPDMDDYAFYSLTATIECAKNILGVYSATHP
jgi:hypothetical protein